MHNKQPTIDSFSKEVLAAFIKSHAHFLCPADLIKKLTKLDQQLRLEALMREAERLAAEGAALSKDLTRLDEFLATGDRLRKIWADQEILRREMRDG